MIWSIRNLRFFDTGYTDNYLHFKNLGSEAEINTRIS